MSRKYHTIRFSIIVTAPLVAIVGVLALVLIRKTANPDFWLAGAAALVPIVLAIAGKVRRPATTPSISELDEQATILAGMVLKQWSDEVELRISVYPLPVPFTAATEITANLILKNAQGEEERRKGTVCVMDSWTAILRDPDREPPSIDGTYNSVTGKFGADGLPSRLVVLGEPGSGKSILAQGLTVGLLRSRQADDDAARRSKAIPVLLPLATWDPAVPLTEWAAVQMVRIYPRLGRELQGKDGARRTLADWLIDQGRVLMVLDGLDEVSRENQRAAFRRLSDAAAKNQAMVVTCRTTEYAQIVHDAKRQPMPKTPVVRLHALPPEQVRTYLTKADDRQFMSPRFGRLLERIESDPGGPLATALSSPFALWLVSTVYRDPDMDPADLISFHSEQEVLKHLLDGLVTAAYAFETDDFAAQEDAAVEVTRRRLTMLARSLGPKPEFQNIDWWKLPQQAPNLFVGSVIGALVASVLGTAVGLAAASRFSPHAGVLLGIVFGIVTGVLAGVTSVRPQDHPRTVDLRFTLDYQRFVGCLTVGIAVGLCAAFADARHGGLIAGLITAAVVGPACAAPCVKAFGLAPGLTAGVTASIALGLSSGLSEGNGHPAWSGVAVAFVFTLSAWVFVGLFQPAQDKLVVSPQLLLDRDRIGCMVVAATAGIAFGIVYGVALGPWFGAIALVALTISVAATVSMWGAFNVSRVWLAVAGELPIRIMAFLDEAYCRGVLRQVGGSYQFRHTELKEALLASARRRDDERAPAEPQVAVDPLAAKAEL
jgi:hypothetical protein